MTTVSRNEVRRALRTIEDNAYRYWEHAYDEDVPPDINPAANLISTELWCRKIDRSWATIQRWLRAKQTPRDQATRQAILAVAERVEEFLNEEREYKEALARYEKEQWERQWGVR